MRAQITGFAKIMGASRQEAVTGSIWHSDSIYNRIHIYQFHVGQNYT